MSIQLLPSQVDHVQKLQAIHKQVSFAIDLSMLGSGKTFTSSHMALQGFKHIVVVAPVSVLTKWNHMKKAYNVPITNMISYCQLRSTKCKQPKHDLLYRKDYKTQMQSPSSGLTIDVDKVDFFASDLYKKYVDEGVMLIIDEFQNVKNVSSQFLACRALIGEVVQATHQRSKVLLLSGSPIDKEEQAVTLFRLLHIMRSDELVRWNVRDRTYEYAGIAEVWEFCRKVYSGPLPALNWHRNTLADACRKQCFKILETILKPHITASMPPLRMSTSLSKRNAFYTVRDASEARLLQHAVQNLSQASRYNDATRRVDFAHNGIQALTAITAALQQVETAKIGTFERVARAGLQATPNLKVVICINFSATLTDLVERLREFNPLVLRGSMSKQQRVNVLEKFQTASTEHRLLVGNVHVCSTGIDLDDKHGQYPRLALVSPNYSTITLYQLGHRFQRVDSKSSATVHMVYGTNAPETNILDALSKKSDIMQRITTEQAMAGVVFPGDYEEFHEA